MFNAVLKLSLHVGICVAAFCVAFYCMLAIKCMCDMFVVFCYCCSDGKLY